MNVLLLLGFVWAEGISVLFGVLQVYRMSDGVEVA